MRRGDVTRRTAAHTAARTCVDGTIGARTTRSAALGRHGDSLAARRSLGVAGVGSDRAEPAMQRKRRGDVTRHTAHTTRRVRVRVSTARSAQARRGRRRSVGTTTRSRLGARSAGVAGVGSDRAEPAMQRKRRGDVTRHTAHTTRRVRVRVSTARSAHARRGRRRSVGTTTRSRLGARSAGVAGVGSDRAEPAMQRKRRGDVTRHTAHTTRRVRVRVSTARSAHARRGRRRSVGTTTRSRLGARSAGVAGVGSDRAEPAMQRKRRGDVTRHTAHTTRRVRVRVSTARSAHARRGRRRSVGTATRSRLGARSAGVAGVGSDRAEPAMQRKRRGDVTRHTAHTTRRVRVRVSTARSAHARRGRRRSVGTTTRSRLGARSAGVAGVGSDRAEPAMQRKRRGDVTRHTAHTTRRVRVRVSTARSAHARRGRRRSVGTTTRSRLGARSAGVAGVGSDRAEPAMQRKRRGDVTRHTAHTTRRVRVRVSTARSAHARRGRRRSVGTTTRSRLGARSAGVAGVGSDRAEPAMQRKRRGDVTRHTAHTTRRVRVRVSTARSAHARRGRRRSVGTTTRSRLGARSAGVAGVGSDRAEPAMQRKRRGDVTRHTAHTTRRVRVRVSTARSAQARRGRRRSVGTTTRSRLGARSAGVAGVGSDRAEPAMQRKRRGDVTRHTAHTTRRVRVRVSTARSAHARRGRRRSVGTTTRSRLGARSAGVAGVGSDRAEPAMQRKRRGDVTRHTAHTTRRVRVRVSTARSAHARRGRRRSVGTTTRSRLGARSAGVAGVGSDRAEPAMQRKRRGDVTRHTAHTTRRVRVRVSTARSAHARRGRRRSVGTTTRSRLGARSAGVAGVGSDRAEPAMQRKRRGDVTRHTAHTTRRVRVRVSTARSAQARRGRRRSVGTTTRSRLGARSAGVAGVGSDRAEPAMQRKRRGDVTRHTAHTTRRVRVRVSTARSAQARRGRRRSVGTTTRSRLGARSAGVAGVGSDRAEPAMQRKRRGDVTRHTAHTTRRVRVRVSTARPAHARRGRRRSVGTTTRSRLGARSAGVAGVGSDRAEPAMQRKRHGDVTRHTAHTTRRVRVRVSTARSAHARRGRRRSVGTTTRSRLGARSAGVAGVGSDRAEPAMQRKRRGDVTRHTAHTTRRVRVRVSTARSAHARRGRRRSVGTATRSRLGARSAGVAGVGSDRAEPAMQRKRRGDVTRHTAHTTRRVRVRVSTARSAHARRGRRRSVGTTTRSRLGARSAGVAGVGSDRAEPAMQRKRRGDVTRHTAHTTRRVRVRVSTARSAHARRGRRRSVGTTTRSRLGARSAGVAGVGSDRAEPAMQRKRRGDVTRHTAHTTRRARVRVSTARPAHARRGRRRSVGTTTRSRLGARSAGVAGVGSDRAEPAMQRKRHGDVTRHTAHTTRRVRVRVSTARSAHARRGRRRSVGTATRSRLGARSAGVAGVGSDRAEPAMQRKRRGDVTRHTAHTTRRVRVRVSTARSAQARRGRRRSAGTTTRSRLGARSAGVAGVGSDRAEPAMQRKRRGDVTRHTAHTTRRVRVRVSTARSAHARRGRRRSVGTTTRSRLGARSAGVAGVGSDRAEPAMQRKRRGDVTRHTAHTTRRVRVRVSTARSAHARRGRRRSVGTTTRSRLGARSAGVAGVGSDRAEPAMQRKRRGDVTRHTAHTTRRVRVRVSTARSAHARRGRRRSVGTTTRSRLGARSAGVAGVGSDRAEPAMQRKRRGDVTRHTAHTTRRVRVRVSTARSAHARRGRRRSVGTTTRSRLGARSAGVAGVGSDRAEPAMQRKRRGDVTRHTAHTTRRVRVRVSTARSAHARRGRRRSVGTTTRSRLGARSAGVAGVGSDRAEPAMQRKRRGDVTRHTAHTTRRVRVRVSTARPAQARRGRRRSVGTTTRSRLGARSAGVAGVGSDRAEPAMQRKRRGDVTRHTAHTTRRVRVRVSTARPAQARRGRRRSVGTTTRSRLGARSAGVAGVGSDRAEPAMQRKRRGDVTRHTAHTTRRVRVRVSTARSAQARRGRRRSVGTTTRSRLGARSAGVAGVGSDRAEPAMQRKRRGDVTRHTAHTTRRVRARVSTARSAQARRGRRRSVGTTARSRRGARSAGVAGVGSDRAEPAMQRKRRGDVTRHTAHTTRRVRVRVSTARPAQTRRGRRRSVGTTTRSRRGARSAGVAGVGSDRAEPAMHRKRRGDVTRHTAHTTRRVRVRVSTARSARARRGRRRSVGTTTRSRLGARSAGVAGVGSDRAEPAMQRKRRGVIVTRHTAHTARRVRVRVSTARSAHARRSRRRSVGTTTRSRPGARSAGVAGVGSDRAEPAMQRKRR